MTSSWQETSQHRPPPFYYGRYPSLAKSSWKYKGNLDKLSLASSVKDAMVIHQQHTVGAYWGRGKMTPILQMSFSNAFSYLKTLEFQVKFHWNVFFGVYLEIFLHWFDAKPLSEQIMAWFSKTYMYAWFGLNEFMHITKRRGMSRWQQYWATYTQYFIFGVVFRLQTAFCLHPYVINCITDVIHCVPVVPSVIRDLCYHWFE